MKNKIAVILLSVSMAAISLNGCGKSDKQAEKNLAREWENENAVHGVVSKVTEDTVIIKVADGNMASMADLELTGEEQEITVTKDSVIRRRNMVGMPENGDAPQPPAGEMPENGDAPQPPVGEAAENGDVPQPPDSRQGMEDGKMPDREESSEEITISDISVGDIVMVTFADNNNAAEITLMPSKRGGEKSETPKSKESDQKDTTI